MTFFLLFGEPQADIFSRSQVVEVAPAPHLADETLQGLFKDAITISRKIGYSNAGTVEFLVDQMGRHYFIEVSRFP